MISIHLKDAEIQQLAQGPVKDEQSLQHLTGCVSCKSKYELYKKLFSEISLISYPQVPAGFEERLMDNFIRSQEQKRILLRYRVMCAGIVAASLTGCLFFLLNDMMLKQLTFFLKPFPGTAESIESILAMAAVIFVYICLSCFRVSSAKEQLFSEINF